MAHFHRLDADADREFLARGETDPFTGTPFRPTNVVVKAEDGTVLLRETWEALGGRYAGSAKTLPWGASAGDGAATPPPARPEAAAVTAGAAAGAATGAGALPKPPRQHAPPPTPMPDHVRERRAKRPWLLPVLAVVGVALALIVGLLVMSGLRDDDPVEAPIVETDEPDAPEITTVQAGVIEGALAEGDAERNGRFEDRYAFVADSSGRVLEFALVSDDFRPDLVVRGPDGQQYEARPVGDEGNRVVVADLRGPGRFQIIVTSREPAGEGSYSLAIRQETPITALRTDGQTVRATLGERSVLVDGFFRDTYEFPVEAEREYTLAVASSAFEVATTLTGRNGARVTTAREGDAVTFTPTEAGRYRLVVSSRERGKRGAYTVNLTAGPAPEADVPEAPRVLQPNTAPLRDSLAVGQQRTYTFAGQIGDRVRVDARALGFSPRLVMVGPDGQRITGDTNDERASVQGTVATAGTYRVILTGGEGSGLVQLSLEKTEAPRADDIPRMPGLDRPPAPAPAPTQGGGGQNGQPYEAQPIDAP